MRTLGKLAAYKRKAIKAERDNNRNNILTIFGVREAKKKREREKSVQHVLDIPFYRFIYIRGENTKNKLFVLCETWKIWIKFVHCFIFSRFKRPRIPLFAAIARWKSIFKFFWRWCNSFHINRCHCNLIINCVCAIAQRAGACKHTHIQKRILHGIFQLCLLFIWIIC